MNNEQFYLGTAVRNPLVLISGRVDIVTGAEVIDQSILDILSTPQGTRLMLPEYGSRIEELMFEPNDDILTGALEVLILEALQMWERRTYIVSVETEVSPNDDNIINCLIKHRPLASNEIRSFVYPFYRELIY